MRAPVVFSRFSCPCRFGLVVLVVGLLLGSLPPLVDCREAFAGEPMPSATLSQGDWETALEAAVDGGDGTSLVSEALVGKPVRFVNQVVPLDGQVPVLGSFAVDGMVYAVTGEGTVELVAVAPSFLAGSLAVGSDGTEGEEASEPVVLEIPESVEHDGVAYSVTSIGPRTFVSCGADVVRIPASVASVDEAAFRGSSVGSVEVAEGNPNLASYEGVLYDADLTSLLLIPEGKKGVVRIHSNTSAITPDALSHCASVTSVEVDAGNEAFHSENGSLYDPGDNLLWAPPGLGEGLDEAGVALPVASYGSSLGYAAGSHHIFSKETRYARTMPATGGAWGSWSTSNTNSWVHPTFNLIAYKFYDGHYYARVGPSSSATLISQSGGGSAKTYKHCKVGASATGPWTYLGSSNTYTNVSAATYVVLWSDNYTITLDKQSGSGGTSTLSVEPPGGGRLPSVSVPTRSGYSFGGYYSSTGGAGTQYFSSSGASVRDWDYSCPTTLYAKWVDNTAYHTVTLERKGGSGGDSSKSVRSGSSMPYVSRPTLSGWAFSGYTDDFSTSTYLFVNASGYGTSRTITSSRTLYANWTKTVSLSANGGTAGSLASLTAGIGRPLGQVCSQVSSSDPDYPIRSMFARSITGTSGWKPTKAGYTFMGYWDTSASTGGKCWISASGTGSTVTSALPSTLYARWGPVTYAISWDGNGGTPSMATTYVGSGEKPVPPSPAPTRTGYELVGWNTDKDATTGWTGTGFAAATRDKAYYAIWRARSYAISYDCAGGELPAGARASYTIEDAFDLPEPAREGHAFLGWEVSGASGAGVAHEGAVATVRKGTYGDLSCMACWQARSYEVSFDPNGGEGGQADAVTAIYGQAMPAVSAAPPTRAGYAFAGWWDSAGPDGGTRYYGADGTSAHIWDKASDATLYARWEAVPYAISYDCAGGELPEGARSSYAIEDAFDLPVPARYGYQFEGWDVSGVAEDGSAGPVLGAGVEDSTAEDGSKVTRVKAGTYGDLSCTARWTLRYDLDVPVADPGSVTFEADSLTGQVRVKPGTSAEGAILSYMAVPVALDSLACEGLDSSGSPDPAGGAPELEAIFGAGSASKVRFTATLKGEGMDLALKVTAGQTASPPALSTFAIPAATSHDAPGRIPVSYGLELDSDLAIPPVRDAAPVARLAYTVSLAGAGA